MEAPALENLLGAYFHQDWFDEHGDEWATLEDFIEGEPQLAPLLPREIDRVLDEILTEDAVASFLRSLGSCYTTTLEEGGHRGWLAEVSLRVAVATGQTNSN